MRPYFTLLLAAVSFFAHAGPVVNPNGSVMTPNSELTRNQLVATDVSGLLSSESDPNVVFTNGELLVRGERVKTGPDETEVQEIANAAVETNALTVATTNRVAAHVANTNNPHAVTAEQVGAVPLVEDYEGNKTAVTIGNRAIGIPVGEHSVANGKNMTASGSYSHAEGDETSASGICSHAEGDETSASGICSHAEGAATTASGDYSHAEGVNTTASGDLSHAEGSNTTASGDYSHAEGSYTTASGYYSHADGVLSLSNDDFSYTWNGNYHVGDNPYPSHGPGTFNINPEGGLDGFWIGAQTLYAILTNKADKSTTYTKEKTDSLLDVKVSKSGDTMTGGLSVPEIEITDGGKVYGARRISAGGYTGNDGDSDPAMFPAGIAGPPMYEWDNYSYARFPFGLRADSYVGSSSGFIGFEDDGYGVQEVYAKFPNGLYSPSTAYVEAYAGGSPSAPLPAYFPNGIIGRDGLVDFFSLDDTTRSDLRPDGTQVATLGLLDSEGYIKSESDPLFTAWLDNSFSNSVLAVGLNIDTNAVAVLNEIADGFGGFPIEGTATTVGGLLAALAAAIAWLKKNKVQTLKLDDGSIQTSADGGVAKLDDFFTNSNSLLTGTIDDRLPIPISEKSAGFTTESYKRFIVTVSGDMTVTLHAPTSGDAEIFECRFNGTSLAADASITFAGATATTMDANCGTVTAGKVALMSAFWNGTTWDVNWKVEG